MKDFIQKKLNFFCINLIMEKTFQTQLSSQIRNAMLMLKTGIELEIFHLFLANYLIE